MTGLLDVSQLTLHERQQLRHRLADLAFIDQFLMAEELSSLSGVAVGDIVRSDPEPPRNCDGGPVDAGLLELASTRPDAA
jgi:hypothetical protein